jgi:hypothetical protein
MVLLVGEAEYFPGRGGKLVAIDMIAMFVTPLSRMHDRAKTKMDVSGSAKGGSTKLKSMVFTFPTLNVGESVAQSAQPTQLIETTVAD